jgi:hypothetical protein
LSKIAEVSMAAGDADGDATVVGYKQNNIKDR